MAGPVEWCSPDNHTCSFMSQPLVKPVRRDEASAVGQRITECWLRRRCLGSGVNHHCCAGHILRPRWDESPPHQR